MQRVAAPFEMCFLRLQMEAKDEADEEGEGEGDDYEETFGRHSQIFFGPVFNLHLKIFYP